MEGYREIYSTNNHIQLNQIEQALQNAGIEVLIKGRQAVEIGNIELTGIRGAQILVKELQYKSAKEILKSLDIDTEESLDPESPNRMILWVGIFLILALFYMIYAAYFS
jgi:hypothetical protein